MPWEETLGQRYIAMYRLKLCHAQIVHKLSEWRTFQASKVYSLGRMNCHIPEAAKAGARKVIMKEASRSRFCTIVDSAKRQHKVSAFYIIKFMTVASRFGV